MVERLVDIADAAVQLANHAVEARVGRGVNVPLQQRNCVVHFVLLLENVGQQVGGRQEVRVLAQRLLQRAFCLHQQTWLIHQHLGVQLK